jgi:hypothetical protein
MIGRRRKTTCRANAVESWGAAIISTTRIGNRSSAARTSRAPTHLIQSATLCHFAKTSFDSELQLDELRRHRPLNAAVYVSPSLLIRAERWSTHNYCARKQLCVADRQHLRVAPRFVMTLGLFSLSERCHDTVSVGGVWR